MTTPSPPRKDDRIALNDLPDQTALEAAVMGSEGEHGVAFIGRLRQVKSFVDTHGRLPRSRARGDAIPAEELAAGSWVRYVRRRGDKLGQQRADLIDSVIPGLREPEREYLDWEVRLMQYADFIRTHGHRPRQLTSCPLPNETVLSDWRGEVKRKPQLLTAERLCLIEKHCPDLLQPNGYYRSWEESLELYLAHLKAYGKEPRQDVPEERRLGLWVVKMRISRDELTPQRIAILAECAPELLSPSHRTEQVLSRRIAEVQEYQRASGRWPRYGSKNSTDLEKHLGKWCYQQRRKSGTMNPERLQTIREALPGMLEGMQDRAPVS